MVDDKNSTQAAAIEQATAADDHIGEALSCLLEALRLAQWAKDTELAHTLQVRIFKLRNAID